MANTSESAGILLYRHGADALEVLIAHPGGPFWVRRDAGAWTIPKGLIEPGEGPLEAARREFAEEVGPLPDGVAIDLGVITQKAGKSVHGFAISGNFDPAELASNEVTMEYPRGSGRIIQFPEIDRVIWCTAGVAAAKLNPAQVEFVNRLLELVDN